MILQSFLVTTPPGPGGSFGPSGPRERSGRSDAGSFGMFLFLAALSVLFIASIVLYLFFRVQAERWPRLPSGLTLSTIILVVSSVTMHAAWVGVRTDRRRLFKAAMLLTLVLGLAFLGCQIVNWLELIGPWRATLSEAAAQLSRATSQSAAAAISLTQSALPYSFFYLLTILHAAHVVGGLVPLGVVTGKAFAGRYSATSAAGVKHCAAYWHFLDVVWLVLFAVLTLGG